MMFMLIFLFLGVVECELYYLNELPDKFPEQSEKYLNRSFTMCVVANGDDVENYGIFRLELANGTNGNTQIIENTTNYNPFEILCRPIDKKYEGDFVYFYTTSEDIKSYRGVIYVPDKNEDTNYKVYQSLAESNIIEPTADFRHIVFTLPDDVSEAPEFHSFVDFSKMAGTQFQVFLKTPDDTPQTKLYDTSNGLPITEFILPEEYFYIKSSTSTPTPGANFSVQARNKMKYSKNGIVYQLSSPDGGNPDNRTISLDTPFSSSKIQFRVESMKCADEETSNDVKVSSRFFNELVAEGGSVVRVTFDVLSELDQFTVSYTCNYIIQFVIEEYTFTTASPESTTKSSSSESPQSTASTKGSDVETSPTTPCIVPTTTSTTTIATTTQSSGDVSLHLLTMIFATFYLI